MGILAAIIQRQATGRGQRIEVAQQDVVVNLHRIHLREYYQTGQAGGARGNRAKVTAPVQSLPLPAVRAQRLRLRPRARTRTCGGRLLASSDGPSSGDDPRSPTDGTRVQRTDDEVDALVEAWTEKHTKHEAMEKLGAAGVPCGAVLDSAEVLTIHRLSSMAG